MPENLMAHITPLVVETAGPGGQSVRTVAPLHIENVAQALGTSIRAVEVAVLENGIVPMRYLRNQNVLNNQDQLRLLGSKAAVVGLGGLGGTVIEILARAGVGALTLIDGDRFEGHNLNRRLLSTRHCLGESKAKIAAQRVDAINVAVTVTAQPIYLNAGNGSGLIKGCDVVVDCLDDISSRLDLEAVAKQAGIPMVSAAVAGVTGHVTTIFPEDIGLELIYGPRHSIRHPKGVETTLGCLPQAVTLIAAVESAEVLKILLHQTGQLLRHKLWVVDLMDNTFEVLALA